jgi:hypothetical protein
LNKYKQREWLSVGGFEPIEFYEGLDNQGLNYGPYFRPMKQVSIGKDRVLVKIEADERIENNKGEYLLHPTILDATFQSFVAAVVSDETSATDPYVPVKIEREILSPVKEPGPITHTNLAISSI